MANNHVPAIEGVSQFGKKITQWEHPAALIKFKHWKFSHH
ncbi:hypothetical protein RintRC_7438 [Richelia intracellularis]|nr:hypothetical protein RintRC_7438 [Richelia intracellularis]